MSVLTLTLHLFIAVFLSCLLIEQVSGNKLANGGSLDLYHALLRERGQYYHHKVDVASLVNF